MLNEFEKQSSVPKVYAFLGLAGIYFFLIFFNIGGEFLVNIAGFALPGYYSLDALFSPGKADDTQVSLYIQCGYCSCDESLPAFTKDYMLMSASG